MDVDRVVNILLIEDEVYVIERVKSIVSKFNNLKLEVVTDFKNAREKLETFNWDVVITSVFIYGLSSLEVLSMLKNKNKDGCVIVLTGISTVDVAKKTVLEGAFDYVIKPQDIERVESLLKIYLISKK